MCLLYLIKFSRFCYLFAMIDVFFIVVINLADRQISPTQTFSFSVRIRREMDAGLVVPKIMVAFAIYIAGLILDERQIK